MLERTLFRLPPPQRIEPTPTQLETLDLIALHEGRPLPPTVSREALRNLLRRDLAVCVAMGPARYMLTGIGRLVRGRKK